MLPNFIIIGAHKAGTSSVYKYLKQHPDIYMPEIKEPRYFCFDHDNSSHQNKSRLIFPVRTREEYEDLFIAGADKKLIGEASPEYLNSPISARKIHDLIPKVKLIAGLRQPVDRAYSLYQMSVREGRTTENFSSWIHSILNSSGYSRDTLFYYNNLKRYYDQFNHKHLKIYLFDDMKKDTAGLINEIYQFLDADPMFKPDTSVQYNPGGIPRNNFLHKILYVKKFKHSLKAILPVSFQKLGKSLYTKNLEKAPKLDSVLKENLNTYFEEDVKKLEELIDRDLSLWLSDH